MFGAGGYWGGGERYALELARAEAELVPTRLVSFGEEARRLRLGPLQIHVLPIRFRFKRNYLNPISELLPLEVADARVLHVHQDSTILTDAVALIGAAMGKRVVVTDLGGAAPSMRRVFDTSRLISAHLAVSRFAASMNPHYAGRTHVIYGGADLARFRRGSAPRRKVVVYVGRVMPHKGIHDLIDAVDPDMPLEIYGRTYDQSYRTALNEKAAGKHVRFFDSAADDEVVRALQTARVSVLPSVYRSPFGGPYPKPELLGLSLIEAMACATPVVASSAASLPEIVDDGRCGLVFEAGNPTDLRDRLRHLWADDDLWDRMSEAAYDRVHELFTWPLTARRALQAYEAVR